MSGGLPFGNRNGSCMRRGMTMPFMQTWIEGAKTEPGELEELDVAF